MRADRLVATLLFLQAKGRATASEVATELEVSLATARRDLSALSTAGVPVYAQPGRGGGWMLVGGSRTDLTGLTADEARALFLLMGPTASEGSPVRSALRKLLQALPDTFRADADAAAGAIVIDSVPWGGRLRALPEVLAVLQEAVVRRRRVSLGYEDRAGARTQRIVEPLGLVQKDDLWYLVGGTATGQRTFRVERIVDATATDESSTRPADFHLAREWDRTVEEMEQHRSRIRAVLLIEERLAAILISQFGRHGELVGLVDDGRARVAVAGPTALSIAQTVAGWGAAVEVLEPETVRSELARLGSELVALHGA